MMCVWILRLHVFLYARMHAYVYVCIGAEKFINAQSRTNGTRDLEALAHCTWRYGALWYVTRLDILCHKGMTHSYVCAIRDSNVWDKVPSALLYCSNTSHDSFTAAIRDMTHSHWKTTHVRACDDSFADAWDEMPIIRLWNIMWDKYNKTRDNQHRVIASWCVMCHCTTCFARYCWQECKWHFFQVVVQLFVLLLLQLQCTIQCGENSYFFTSYSFLSSSFFRVGLICRKTCKDKASHGAFDSDLWLASSFSAVCSPRTKVLCLAYM